MAQRAGRANNPAYLTSKSRRLGHSAGRVRRVLVSLPSTDEILEAVRSVDSSYHRLVLIVGATGKTAALERVARDQGWALVNLNLSLSERLLELTRAHRARRASAIAEEIVKEAGTATVLLDNLEILFGVDLQLDPLRLLQALSRFRTVAAAWPGSLDGGHLVYAEPGHPEYRREARPDTPIVLMGRA